MRERFVVRSVTGYAITANAHGTEGKCKTIWYVLDSAVCFHRVDRLNHWNRYGETGERNARELAARLNAEDARTRQEGHLFISQVGA